MGGGTGAVTVAGIRAANGGDLMGAGVRETSGRGPEGACIGRGGATRRAGDAAGTESTARFPLVVGAEGG